MNSDKLKITFLLIGVLAICTFFISVGNEMDIARLEAENDRLVVVIDSVHADLSYINAKIKLMEGLR